MAGGKGKTVDAEAVVLASLLRTYPRVAPAGMIDMWRRKLISQVAANVVGYNGHLANGLTALFIACGRDVANVADAAAGVTTFDLASRGELYLSVTPPSLTIGTVGGTHLGTSRECLRLVVCDGAGDAPRFAEIAAATALSSELSIGAAIAAGEIVGAHEQYGPNRPEEPDATVSHQDGDGKGRVRV
jgi:hydroxymethylglutaryl-CoA reductase (NADPH)